MKYLFVVLMLTIPTNVFAYGCDCGSVQAIVTTAKIETIQTVNLHTSQEAEAIRSEILRAAQNIIGTIKTESATIVRAIMALKESNVAAIKGQGVAAETMKAQDLYGKGAQPNGLCGASALGAGVQLSTQAQKEVQKALREKQGDYANNKDAIPLDYLRRILEENHLKRGETVEAFFPINTTLTAEDVSKAHEAVKTLTTPNPLPVITEGQKNTPAGQTYEASRKVHDARLALAAEVLNEHIAFHAPTLPDDVTTWATNQWNEAGGSGTPPGLVDGKLSEAGLYSLLSQMRMGNPNWFTHIASSTEAGLLRELALMQAMQVEQNRRNNALLSHMAVIASLSFLTDMEGTKASELKDLYTRMLGTQQ